ncbi:MAG: hypothetical protein AUJ04_04470 [Acidobacteria bacterium 13_1_40CM_3_55_6]|nr:MAG: hypothetical protein AUJ04_04470 [Acidobacteria bacterium 13_1_40CM_3_55_6]
MGAAVVERNSLTVEPTRGDRFAVVIWALTATIALAVLALIITAPLAQAGNHTGFSSTIYTAFSFICHQIPERSFHVAGHQFAVCSRCTGLYAGFALAALIYPLARSLKRSDTPRRIWLILAAVPLLIDFALGYFSIWENTHLSRFLTGALLSSLAVFYVMPGLIELSHAIGGRLARKAE